MQVYLSNSVGDWLITFRYGVALLEGIKSGSERIEGTKLNDFPKPVEVGNGVPNCFSILTNFIKAMSLEQCIARSGFV